MDSILGTIAKMLGIAENDTFYDIDLTVFINSAIMVLTDIGVGPDRGFSIVDRNATWNDYLGEDVNQLESVKEFIYLKVKLVFNPPTSQSVIQAYNERLKELEYRLHAKTNY